MNYVMIRECSEGANTVKKFLVNQEKTKFHHPSWGWVALPNNAVVLTEGDRQSA